jgi:hypothetical protein
VVDVRLGQPEQLGDLAQVLPVGTRHLGQVRAVQVDRGRTADAELGGDGNERVGLRDRDVPVEQCVVEQRQVFEPAYFGRRGRHCVHQPGEEVLWPCGDLAGDPLPARQCEDRPGMFLGDHELLRPRGPPGSARR